MNNYDSIKKLSSLRRVNSVLVRIKTRIKRFTARNHSKPEPQSLVSGVDIDKLSIEAITFMKSFYLDVVNRHSQIDTEILVSRCHTDEQRKYASQLLGEHYRILPALAQAGKVMHVVEIGSATGMSALQLRNYGFKVTCFDIIPWDLIENQLLKSEDFSEGKLDWIVADLSISENFDLHCKLLESADMIFIDAPKDGVFEYQLIPKLLNLKYLNPYAMLVIDDIDFHNMKQLWHSIGPGRIDFTFLGHNSGTGVVWPKFCDKST